MRIVGLRRARSMFLLARRRAVDILRTGRVYRTPCLRGHTMSDDTKKRALVLLSGGLDSQLAIFVLRAQGVAARAVAFDSPFFDVEKARRAALQCDVPLEIVNFSADIIGLLRQPKHGFGSCMNPCIDCHALMLRRAGERLEELGCHFLCTGEVLNQRPMSQNRNSLETVARESGRPELVLRPLSAQLLPETHPEQARWVDRGALLGIRGRSRKQQLRMAEELGFASVPSPAGGCRLTEPNFCRRLHDLQAHEGLNGVRSIELLRVGRHFRLDDRLKLIVGRNENDNTQLEGGAELYDLIIRVEGVPGPTALLPFTADAEQVRLAASICARYSDCGPGHPVEVRIRSSRGIEQVTVRPMSPVQTDRLKV